MNIFLSEKQLDKYLMNVYQLKNVIRYNTRNKLKDESVAEHSFYVALFALKLCNEYQIDMQTTLQSLIKALLHDMPEIELNDITHNVKQRLKLDEFLKSYEKEYYEKNFQRYVELMTNDKNTLVNAIVNYADVLSVRQYCLNELLLGNNSDDIEEIFKESKHRLNECYKTLEQTMERKQ